MAETNITALAVFDNGTELTYVEKDGEILFTAEEIGRHLGYSDPSRAINKLFERNQNELKLYSSVVKLTTEQEFQRSTRVFTEEGVYIISMLARTNEAKKFRARVALLLRRLRQAAIIQAETQARVTASTTTLALLPSERLHLKKILQFRKRGFSRREIVKVTGIHARTVQNLMRTAKTLGLEV